MRFLARPALIFVFVLSTLSISSQGFAANKVKEGTGETQRQVRYNEVFDQKGQVRSQYQLIIQAWARRVHHMHEYAEQTFQEFKRGKHDSNSINDLPLMYPKAEYAEVVRGVQQRERAIQAFLRDHYSGVKAYAKQGIISAAKVDAIILRSGEDGYQGLIDENTPLNFLYGPDLIRGPDGVLRALEDNVGFVGGFGDIVLAQQISERLYPEIAQHYQYPKAIEFYHELMDLYTEQAKEFGGKIVMYTDADATDDSEDQRTIELFESLGMEVLTPKSKRRMKFIDDAVYVQDKDGSNREKIGFVVLNLEHSDVDQFHPAAFEKAVLDSAANLAGDKTEKASLRKKVLKELLAYDPKKKNRMKQLKSLQHLMRNSSWWVDPKEESKRAVGLIDAILEGHVGSSYMPGVDFVGDKEIYMHVEEFVRFYLHEEPIIRNVETYMFDQPGVREKVFGNNEQGDELDKWIIKPVDGRGGDGIVFGTEAKAKPHELPALLARVDANAGRLQAQRNTPPSEMPGNRIVDMRALTYSTKQRGITSPVPWSRAATADKSLLINVSAGGAVNGVFVVDPVKPNKPGRRKVLVPRVCEAVFTQVK